MTRVVAEKILRELGLADAAPSVCIGGEWQKCTGAS
jgi:hypothetical protein